MQQVLCRLLVLVFLTMPGYSHAATLYINPAETEIRPGDTISLAVRLDTDEGECINAIDGVITYTENIVPVDISRGESIFPVWVEEPTIDRENREVTFAGGIPNGYCGRIEGDPSLTNVILELIFQAPGLSVGAENGDTATVAFSPRTSALLNDGRGSEASLRSIGSTITVHDQPGSEVVDEWNPRVEADTQPPNPFSITLERDPSIFAGKYFIVFNTTDKQSGIDHYEVMEEPLDALDLFRFGAADAPWITVRSPYELEDQSLNSTIRVKAVDKAGNEYIATLVPDESMRGTSDREQLSLLFGLGGLMVLILLIGAILVYRRNGRSPLEADEPGSDDKNYA